MNTTIELLQKHRSIRKFTDKPVPDATVETIVRTGLSAATSSNLQGITVIRVRKSVTREAIATLAGGQAHVATAGAFLVWCADLHRSALACEIGGGESLGLGICYIGGIRNDPQQVADLLRLPEQVYPVFGLCLGWPDQNPECKPRLPLSATLKEEFYDDSLDRDAIREYDKKMNTYYLSRTRGKVDRVWSEDMSRLLGKESRPHMREFLSTRGFTMR